MMWEGTREIEEADQTEDPDQTKDDAPETRPSKDTKFFHTFRVSNTPRTDRHTRL